jgi:hypothetical protein
MAGHTHLPEIVYPVSPLTEILAANGTLEGTSAVAFSELLQGLRELGVTDAAIRNTFEYEFTKEVKE